MRHVLYLKVWNIPVNLSAIVRQTCPCHANAGMYVFIPFYIFFIFFVSFKPLAMNSISEINYKIPTKETLTTSSSPLRISFRFEKFPFRQLANIGSKPTMLACLHYILFSIILLSR